MDALTIENIVLVGDKFHSDSDIHATTVAYIQHLLTPYAQNIQHLSDIDAIVAWMTDTFPGEHSAQALDYVNLFAPKDFSREQLLKAAKYEMINYFIMYIFERMPNSPHSIILPWDVQKVFIMDHRLASKFGISEGSITLPVSVGVGGNQSVHMMTEDLVAGLLAFCLVSEINFDITMFGVSFDPSFMRPQIGVTNKFIKQNTNSNSVIIGDTTYYFIGTDFMKGFITGAQWANLDHRKYWNNLKDRNEILMTF